MATVPPKPNQTQPVSPQSTAMGGAAAAQLAALPVRTAGPPVTSLTSPPQFSLGHVTMPTLSSKQVRQQGYCLLIQNQP